MASDPSKIRVLIVTRNREAASLYRRNLIEQGYLDDHIEHTANAKDAVSLINAANSKVHKVCIEGIWFSPSQALDMLDPAKFKSRL